METLGVTRVADNIPTNEHRRIAEAVRAACIAAVPEGYQQALMSGLCDEGALEVAISAVRTVDLDAVIATMPVHVPK